MKKKVLLELRVEQYFTTMFLENKTLSYTFWA